MQAADPYNAKTREYFADPRHAGDLDGMVVGYFEDQGIRLQIGASLAENSLNVLRFRCWGCPHAVAAAEAFCRRYEGRALMELEAFDTAQIMSDLGVPVEKTGRILVLEDTVRSLLIALQNQ